MGLRYAIDEVRAEENLFRYSETGGDPNGGFLALYGGLAAVNLTNGGLIDNGDGTFSPTPLATNGGIPFALSVYRPFEREDKEWTYRVNLDWDITDDQMMFSATTGYRSGGYNLVFFEHRDLRPRGADRVRDRLQDSLARWIAAGERFVLSV